MSTYPITTQVVPEATSGQRMHVLDESCWCSPDVVDVTTFSDPGPTEHVVHRSEVSA